VPSQYERPLVGARKLHVLIVEDDDSISMPTKAYLEHEGYETSVSESVAGMRSATMDGTVDLIILDVGLPDEDGWSALRWLRARSGLPVIMLSGRCDTGDKVVGLELGADDYLAKPFELRELLARLRSIQRRLQHAETAVSSAPTEKAIKFAGWVLDPLSQQLTSDTGQLVHLTQMEYQLLALLVQSPRRVVTRDQLMDVMANRDWEPFDRSVDVHISKLRRKIDPVGKVSSLIRTVRGSGYMFIPDGGS
jgi:two-component system, OmpR family, response regulator